MNSSSQHTNLVFIFDSLACIVCIQYTSNTLFLYCPQLAPLILSSRQYSAKVEMNRQLAAQLHPDEVSTLCTYGTHIHTYTHNHVQRCVFELPKRTFRYIAKAVGYVQL
jgi:hypothetical protein